jgi:hypothetical protein
MHTVVPATEVWKPEALVFACMKMQWSGAHDGMRTWVLLARMFRERKPGIFRLRIMAQRLVVVKS